MKQLQLETIKNWLDLYYEFRGDFEEVHSAEWQDSSQRSNTRSEITWYQPSHQSRNYILTMWELRPCFTLRNVSVVTFEYWRTMFSAGSGYRRFSEEFFLPGPWVHLAWQRLAGSARLQPYTGCRPWSRHSAKDGDWQDIPVYSVWQCPELWLESIETAQPTLLFKQELDDDTLSS
jgi:hypothetical protein